MPRCSAAWRLSSFARIVRSAQELHEISPGRHPENVALTLLAMTTGLAAAIIANHQPLQTATSALRDHLDSLFTTTRLAALGANLAHRRSAG
jgi:BetI-type transcriptional repressor, C-terminal